MAAKFLGQFLLERGALTAPQLLAAIEAQRASNPLLGELAVRQGLLDAAQARRIHQRQRVEDRRFGDIALEMGVLGPEQIDALVDAQKAGRKRLGDVLLEQGAIDAERLDAELALHRADHEKARHDFERELAAHPLGDLAESAIGLCARLFPRMLGSQCLPAEVLPPEELALEPERWSCVQYVRVEGELRLGIGLAADLPTARALACALLGIAEDQCDDELAVDALGEMVNVLMGYLVHDVLAGDDTAYRALPPDASVPAAALAADRTRSLAIGMGSQLGGFVLLVDRPA